MRSIREAWATVRFYAVLLLFWGATLSWTLCASVLVLILPGQRGAAIGQFMIMAGFRFFVAVMRRSGIVTCDIKALDALRAEGGLVIAPNHPSLIDAVLVISRLPKVVCITKASLWDNVFLGGSVRMAHYIRNDSPARLVRDAAGALRAGRQLLIFPEGTRTVRAPVNTFRGGFALMARTARVPIQTVFLESDTPYLGKGWPLFRRPQLPIHYTARLGRRFEVEGRTQDFVAGLERYFAEEMRGRGPAGP